MTFMYIMYQAFHYTKSNCVLYNKNVRFIFITHMFQVDTSDEYYIYFSKSSSNAILLKNPLAITKE